MFNALLDPSTRRYQRFTSIYHNHVTSQYDTFLGYHHEIVPYTTLMSIRAGGGYPPWVYFLSYGRGLYVDIFLIIPLFLCKYNTFLLFLTFPLVY